MAVTWKKIAYEDNVVTKALLDAAGDIIYASGDNTPAILSVGSNTEILTVSGGLPSWQAVGANVNLDYVPIVTSGDYTIPTGKSFIGGDEFSIEGTDTLSIEGTGRMILVG